jgi:hypothetical protein
MEVAVGIGFYYKGLFTTKAQRFTMEKPRKPRANHKGTKVTMEKPRKPKIERDFSDYF